MSQTDLFGSEPKLVPDLTYMPGVLVGELELEAALRDLPLKQSTARMYGKVFPVPRLECWFGSRSYAFGGRVEEPQPWTETVLKLKARVEELAATPFDSCFVNYYRHGLDMIDWHADDEPWIGPTIASATFGSARRFVLRHNSTGAKHELYLGDGDLLVMLPGTQEAWQHSVPRTSKTVGARINFTFRQTRQA